jgi:hypothetical protein
VAITARFQLTGEARKILTISFKIQNMCYVLFH